MTAKSLLCLVLLGLAVATPDGWPLCCPVLLSCGDFGPATGYYRAFSILKRDVAPRHESWPHA